jgi:hypothetical protein
MPPNISWVSSDFHDNARFEDGKLRVNFKKGLLGGGVYKSRFTPTTEASLSYQVCFPSDWSAPIGGKLPGLCGGTCPTGGRDSSNGISTRYMFTDKGRKVKLYLYWQGQKSQYGDGFIFGDIKPGSCMQLTQRVKLNDVGKSNGEIQIWQDGRLALNLQNMKLRNGNWNLDTFMFATYYGGNTQDWAPKKNETLFFDDFKVTGGAGLQCAAP